VRAYLSVLRARFRTLLQYRAAAAAGIGTRLFWGVIRTLIFAAFYRSATGPQPLSYPQVLTYIWMGQAMLALTLWRADPEIRAMIQNGSVAYELLRPLDLYWLWYCRAFAACVVPTVLQALPVCTLALLFLGLQPPTPAAATAWVVVLAGAVLLSCAIGTLISVSLLWSLSGDGVSRLMPALSYTLSGMMVPIPLFPAWARSTLEFLPFRGLVDAPFRVYMGHIPPSELLPVLAHQLAWTVAFVLLGRGLLARWRRQVVVQGG
jgi:ABC-2 type transport system permease protein